jgi:ribosome maturation factor RimP
MINKATVQQAVEEWLQGKDYFLVDINISADDRIVVEIDHADGVWIEDCADLSRFIEERVSREEEDYELEVGSAGLGQPFKILRQYEIHVGKEVETLAKDGKKYRGTLLSVDPEGFELGVMQKVKEEGKKRPVNKEVPVRFAYGDVTYTKYLIKIK